MAWAAATGSVAWLSLDAQDNDLARFLKYLTATLHRADPSIAISALSLIESSPITPVESILTGLINDLFPCLIRQHRYEQRERHPAEVQQSRAVADAALGRAGREHGHGLMLPPRRDHRDAIDR